MITAGEKRTRFYDGLQPRGLSKGFPEAVVHELPQVLAMTWETCPHPSRENLPSSYGVQSADGLHLSVPSEST